MSMICWTILHHTAAPVAQGAVRVTHVVRHAVGRAAHRAVRVAHRTATVSGPPRTWAEVVCKFVPAAVAGGGLLIPAPANPPRALDPPAAIVDPAPTVSPWPLDLLGTLDPSGTPTPLGSFRQWITMSRMTRSKRSPKLFRSQAQRSCFSAASAGCC